METETLNKKPGKRTGLFILLFLIVSFIIYYCVMSLMSPKRAMDRISDEFILKLDDKTKIDKKIFSDSAYLKKLKEKAFLQSRIALAESDSIYLTINLSDSTANLEIYGVVVHAVKISDLKMSSILIKGNEYVISSLLSSPFTIARSISTIKKDPVIIKMAPKDTSEYKPDIMPDTTITEPVNYIFEMTNGTRIFIYQEEDSKPGEGRSQLSFDLNDKLRNTISTLRSLAVFKVPEYHPYIKLRVPRSDAKIIYRAIPRNGQIAIFR